MKSDVVRRDKCDRGAMSARRKGKLPQRKTVGVGGKLRLRNHQVCFLETGRTASSIRDIRCRGPFKA